MQLASNVIIFIIHVRRLNKMKQIWDQGPPLEPATETSARRSRAGFGSWFLATVKLTFEKIVKLTFEKISCGEFCIVAYTGPPTSQEDARNWTLRGRYLYENLESVVSTLVYANLFFHLLEINNWRITLNNSSSVSISSWPTTSPLEYLLPANCNEYIK